MHSNAPKINVVVDSAEALTDTMCVKILSVPIRYLSNLYLKVDWKEVPFF